MRWNDNSKGGAGNTTGTAGIVLPWEFVKTINTNATGYYLEIIPIGDRVILGSTGATVNTIYNADLAAVSTTFTDTMKASGAGVIRNGNLLIGGAYVSSDAGATWASGSVFTGKFSPAFPTTYTNRVTCYIDIQLVTSRAYKPSQ